MLFIELSEVCKSKNLRAGDFLQGIRPLAPTFTDSSAGLRMVFHVPSIGGERILCSICSCWGCQFDPSNFRQYPISISTSKCVCVLISSVSILIPALNSPHLSRGRQKYSVSVCHISHASPKAILKYIPRAIKTSTLSPNYQFVKIYPKEMIRFW